MGEPDGNKRLITFFRAEFDADPLPVCRRTCADIDSDIENRAAENTSQFCLGHRRCLQMQSAQRSDFAAERVIVLDKVGVDAAGGPRFLVLDFGKEAAAVAMAIGKHFDESRYREFCKSRHQKSSATRRRR